MHSRVQLVRDSWIPMLWIPWICFLSQASTTFAYPAGCHSKGRECFLPFGLVTLHNFISIQKLERQRLMTRTGQAQLVLSLLYVLLQFTATRSVKDIAGYYDGICDGHDAGRSVGRLSHLVTNCITEWQELLSFSTRTCSGDDFFSMLRLLRLLR